MQGPTVADGILHCSPNRLARSFARHHSALRGLLAVFCPVFPPLPGGFGSTEERLVSGFTSVGRLAGSAVMLKNPGQPMVLPSRSERALPLPLRMSPSRMFTCAGAR